MHSIYSKRRSRKGFVFVAYLATYIELPFITVHIFGKPVTVFKRKNGTFFARETACKHQGADLSAGKLEGSVITCPRHGRRFDLETGECLDGDFPKLREYKVAIFDDAVYVSTHPKRDPYDPRNRFTQGERGHNELSRGYRTSEKHAPLSD